MVSFQEAKQLINYNPETGQFLWKERSVKRFNSRYANKPAGCIHTNQNGKQYVTISINNKRYLAHRVAWLIYTGEWPKNEIDHINGNSLDNRICNLRDVTRSQNNKNLGIGKKNKSGKVGVSFLKKRKKWIADISVNSKNKRLGYFDNKEDAIKARLKAETEYGYLC